MIFKLKPYSWIVVLFVALAVFVRVWKFDQIPPSPYWEEVALGYDAYAVLETGMDHHGNSLPVVAFESFGDWKPAFYFYTVVPFIKLVGLNVWAVRLPSLLSGIAIIFGIGYLTNWLVSLISSKNVSRLEFKMSWPMAVGLGVATFSPWLIQFSRGGWESNLATALMLWGVLLLLNRQRLARQLLGVLLLALAMYTYHAARVIAPYLFSSALIWEFLNRVRPQRRLTVFAAGLKQFCLVRRTYLLLGVFFCLLIPFLLPGQAQKISHRFTETSIFADLSPIIESNLRQERAGHSLLSRIVFHRYRYFGQQILSQIFIHFSPDYLFLSGDINLRHSPGLGGIILPLNAILLIWGGVTLISHHKKGALFFFGWLFVTILPAATSAAVPHALRTLASAPVYLSLIGLGWWQAVGLLRSRLNKRSWWFKVLVSLLILIYSFFFLRYYLYYIHVYPLVSASQWQYGYERMIKSVVDREAVSPDKQVYISRQVGRPAMYYWFYTQTDPREVQSAQSTAKKDQGEFLEFTNKVFIDDLNQVPTNSVILALTDAQYQRYSQSVADLNDKLIFNLEIQDLNQNTIWHVLELR